MSNSREIVALHDWYRSSLELADGMGWLMVGSPAAHAWVLKIATIMQLKGSKSDNYPRLIVVRGENGWKVEDQSTIRFLYHSNMQDLICDLGGEGEEIMEIIKMQEFLNPIYERTINRGGLPLHAALIETDGKGVVLAAPGGTGKSTCCRRIPSPWQVLCDDETLIVLDLQNQYRAHPFPTWSNYLWKHGERTWDVQRHVQLSALFFLEQSEADEAIPVGQGEGAIMLNQSAAQVCQRNWLNLHHEEERELRKKLFDNACELAKTVPAYKLQVSLDGRFWEKMEEVIM